VRSVIAVTIALVLATTVIATWPRTLGGSTSYIAVNGVSMEPTLHSGDLVLVRRADAYTSGDVVAFDTEDGRVIHRIVGGNADGFVLQGDNRDTEDLWRPTNAQILGKTWLHLPAVGTAVLYLQTPVGLGVVAAALASMLASRRPPRRRPRPIKIVRSST
jgi:signal peptidase I